MDLSGSDLPRSWEKKSTHCFATPATIKPAAITLTLKKKEKITSSVFPTQHHMRRSLEGHTQMEIQKYSYVQVCQWGKKRLKQESLRAIHHGIQGTGGKSSPTITTNHFCFLMSNTSPGTFFLAPTILAFVLLFFSSELPECSLGSRTRRRMSSFDSQILTKYFICVEERIMNCTIWNNKKIKAGKVFDVTCDLSLYIQLLSRDTHRVKRDSFFWKGLSLRLPTEPRS